MRATVTILGFAALAYALTCALLFFAQRSILYPAPAGKPSWGEPLGSGRLASTGEQGPVVVHFHGNGESLADLSWAAEFWRERGVSFYAIEYPGYGDVPGSPTEESIYAAARSGLEQLLEQGVSRARIVLIGQSLGTGPAVEMARLGYGKKLVLLSPFTSLGDVAQDAFPFLPARWLVRDRFDSASKASSIRVPVLVVHGEQDEVVPYSLGERLAPLFPTGQLLTVQRGRHNDLWLAPEVREQVTRFVLTP